jgi:hypothetical protein
MMVQVSKMYLRGGKLSSCSLGGHAYIGIIYLCMYVCMYVSMYVYIYIDTHDGSSLKDVPSRG